ncbi:unnamed protein product [Mytilus coruscus]|uniref:Uncharacterized protein n=1 Tax=Mytilus coruscus TaxID=42192 RepID=A0A6J7ZTW7_MYTCO|nr:unnamed protein product [Mytilus coruscus]
MHVSDLKTFLTKRGITFSLYRKQQLVRLCEIAIELQLEVTETQDDYNDMDSFRRTIEILAVICLVGFVTCQSPPSTQPEPTSKAVPEPAPVVRKTVKVTAPQTVATSTKKGCDPACDTPFETCVRLAKCQGNDCFRCAVTVSIVLPGTSKETMTKPAKETPVTLPANLPNVMQLLNSAQNNPLMKMPAQTGNSLFGSQEWVLSCSTVECSSKRIQTT